MHPYHVVVSEPVSTSAPDLSSWLRPDAILLHIGVHKTGTTAIQSAFAQAHEPLVAAGIAHLAPRSHFDAGMAALARSPGWDSSGEPRGRDRWLEVVRKARAHQGRVLFSSEALCEATDEQARQIVEEMGVGRTQVLVTLRPLEALLPSTWQQYLKSGFDQPYARWLRHVLKSKDAKTTRSFWRRNDHGRVIERWGALVGPENVAVLIVDSRDRQGIYRDFESLLGLPEGSLRPQEWLPANRSLSAPEAEALRRFNKRMRDEMPSATYYRLIRRGAAVTLVEGRRPAPGEQAIVTPGWAVKRAREYGAESVRRILATGSPVFGSVEVLLPTHAIDEDAKSTKPAEIPVDIAPLLLEGAVRATMGQRYGDRAGVAHSSGLALVPVKELVTELKSRARRRLRRSR